MTRRIPIFARLAAFGAFGLLIGSLLLEPSTATSGRGALTWINQAQAQTPPPPLADAGSDRTVAVGATVVLDGSGTTDPESALLSFTWQFTSTPTGSLASLSDANAVRPNFEADLSGTYLLELTAADGVRASAPDAVTIIADNSVPVADAGPDQIAGVGATVELDGSGSIGANGNAVTDHSWSIWSKPAGSAEDLVGRFQVHPQLTLDLAGSYVVELMVTDGTSWSVFDFVEINTEGFDAGPDLNATVGATVLLDGNLATGPGGTSLSYAWHLLSVPSGSSATLSTPDGIQQNLTVDVTGLYLAQLSVTDGVGNVSRDTVVVDTDPIKPSADAGRDQTVEVGATVVLDGSGTTDPAGAPLGFTWQFTAVPSGSAASLSDSGAVRPTFVADVAGSYQLELTAADGARASAPDAVVISTDNSVPVADAGLDQIAVIGETIELDAGGTFDVDGNKITSYGWSVWSGPIGSTADLEGRFQVRPKLTLDLAGTYLVELMVSDGTEWSPLDFVEISTEGVAPAADAGPDLRASLGATVLLDGSLTTDADGEELGFDWALLVVPSGSTAALSATDVLRPSLTLDLAGLYLVQLSATDESGRVSRDTLVIDTTSVPPLAQAGPDQTSAPGLDVQFDAAASSDLDGDLLSYRWDVLDVPYGPVQNPVPDGLRPELPIDQLGTHVVQLIVTDGTTTGRPDTAVISTDNSPARPDAGPDQSVAVGATVQLDGSGSSDPDGDLLSYSWALLSASSATAALSDPTLVNPTFVADIAGHYLVQLQASDGYTVKRRDTVVISTVNSRPVADAGLDAGISSGQIVGLDGNGSSDADSDTLTFRWDLIARPAGSAAAVASPTSASTTFTADLAGFYVAQLVVSDGQIDSTPDTVVFTITNQAPVANAGADQNVFVGELATLDGTNSFDPDGDPITFFWSLGTIPMGSTATLSGGTTVSPTFVPDLPGTYVVQLVVNDGLVDSTADVVLVTITNRAPIADAGPNQLVRVGDTVQLDGSASTDPDGDPISFSWSLVSAPVGSVAALSDPNIVDPTFVADLSGDYGLQFVVNDGQLNSASASLVVMANDAPPSNSAPVLDPIGGQTIALGSTLDLLLTATDADGDDLSFMATPLPLPAGAELNAATGAFSFTPGPSQVGDIVLTFSVSDGIATDSESITISVTGAAPGGVTALTGRLLDTNDFVVGVETPIVGASISLLGSGVVTTSDANGNFTLSGVPSGGQVLDIDAATASAAPDGSAYASFREKIDLIADVTNVVSRPFFLPRIDASSVTTVNPTGVTVVENLGLGVSMVLTAGQARNADGTPYDGQISISEVPLALAPASLPEELRPGLLITIQPVGITFDPPVPITFPNIDALEIESPTNIWSLDPDTGQFDVVGIGRVLFDEETGGLNIRTIAGGIRQTDWHFPLPPETDRDPPEDENDENNDPDNCECRNTGSVTHLDSGNLQIDHDLVGYRSLEQTRSLKLVYNSTSADPQPFVPTNTTVVRRSAVPVTVSTRISIAGINQGSEVFTSTSGFSESQDETIRQVVQVDAQQLPTGVYPYRLHTTSNFNSSSVSRLTTGQVLVNNQVKSPFGVGWSLDSLHRVHQQGSTVVLTSGNGSVKRFRPTGDVNFSSGAFFGDPTAPIAQDIGDVNNDGIADILIYEIASGFLQMFLGDGKGGVLSIRELQIGVPSGGAGGGSDLAKVRIGDFDGDRIADLAVGKDNGLFFYRGLGAGFFAGGVPRFSSQLFWLETADMNGDNIDDLVAGGSGVVRIFHGGAGVGPLFVQNIFHSGSVSGIVGRDFNNDGLGDIATVSSNDTLNIYINQNAGNFAISTIPVGLIGFAAINLRFIDAGDVTGDDLPDIVVAGRAAQTVTLFEGDGVGGFVANVLAADQTVFNVNIADLNGDGLGDILVGGGDAASTMSLASVFLSDGVGFVEPASRINGLPEIGGAIPGDFNGDGLVDLAIWRPGPSIDASVGIFLSLLQDVATYRRPPGDFSTLTKNIDGTFVRRLKNGTQFEFDTTGKQTAMIDRNGNTTSYAYDAQERLISITDPVGLVTVLAYSGDRLGSITDPAGRATGFVHDAGGNLVRIVDPDGTSRQFAYDGRRHLTSQMSKRGFVTAYEYGFHGRNIAADRPDGSRREIVSSATVGLVNIFGPSSPGTKGNPVNASRPDARVSRFTDSRGNATVMRTGRLGGATQTIDSLGRTLATERDEDNKPVRTVHRNGRIDESTYDNKGNRLQLREAIGTQLERLTTLEYEPTFNRITRILDPELNSNRFIYDENGNLTRIINSDFTETHMAYNDLNCPGLMTRLTASAGLEEEAVTKFLYDPGTCNLAGTGDALDNAYSRILDLAGNVVSVTDALARATIFQHDPMGRVTMRVDPRNTDLQPICGTLGVTCFAYDMQGNLESVEDGQGEITSFTYDQLERVQTWIDPLGESQQLAYDGDGNLIQVTDRIGQIISFGYDTGNRQTSKIMMPGAPDELVRGFVYDEMDNLTSVSDSNSVLTYTYDLFNRMTSVSTIGAPFQPDTFITYSYDSRDNRLIMEDSGAGITSYTYDALNRMTSLEAPVGSFIFDYDAMSRRKSISRSIGVNTAYAYDTASRLSSIVHEHVGGIVSSFAYGLDAIGKRSSLTQNRPSLPAVAVVSYIYDETDQLTNAESVLVGGVAESYNYDALGNRTASHQSATYVTGVSNRLLEDDGFCYTYDLNGNLTSKTEKMSDFCTGLVTTFSWDVENRLTQLEMPDGRIVQYRYDGLGQRIEKIVDGVGTRYVYDFEDILLEYDQLDFLQARFTRGPGIDEPLLVQRDQNSSGSFEGSEVFMLLSDGQGSITETLDSTGATVFSRLTDAFGNILAESGSLTHPYGFTGREYDPESDLYYYRARYYDSSTGRYISEDPIGFAGRDESAYRYVGNDPTNFIDPTGEAKWAGTAVRLTGTFMKNLGRITMEQARRRRKQGENVQANSRQQAKQIESSANGTEGLLKHKGHELEDGSTGRPHYQSQGKPGHTFWSIAGGLGTGLFCIGEAIEEAGEAAEDALTNLSLDPFDARPAY